MDTTRTKHRCVFVKTIIAMGCYISLKVFFDAPVQNSASKLLFFGETNYSPKYFVRWWFLKDFPSELCGFFEAPGSCC